MGCGGGRQDLNAQVLGVVRENPDTPRVQAHDEVMLSRREQQRANGTVERLKRRACAAAIYDGIESLSAVIIGEFER